jgi:hypothetical protein
MPDTEAFDRGRKISDQKRKELSASRKVQFLAVYEKCGTIRKSCEVLGIGRDVYKKWHAYDWEFAQAIAETRFAFAESLEELALERVKNPDKNRGSDVLLLGLLNANMPQKYRPQISINEDSARDLITEWRKASQSVKKEGPTEEGELSVPVEETLAAILARRSSADKTQQEPEED